MIEIRKSEDRGSADHGWLQSRHTFSFAGYYDPRYMGVSSLRVINDDSVAPGTGFGTHSHRDMEIISFVKRGAIEHKDSMGNIERLPAGEFQVMSAGTGVSHSEYNPSDTETLEFLQIWIQPNVLGIEPGYQQKRFEPKSGLQLVVSNDGREDSLRVQQDAALHHLRLGEGEVATLPVAHNRTLYIHAIAGKLNLKGETLQHGDGATIKNEELLTFNAANDSEALIFDLA